MPLLWEYAVQFGAVHLLRSKISARCAHKGVEQAAGGSTHGLSLLRRGEYLAMLYWDSEMFHRTTRKRRELEGEDTKDYRALLKEMLFVRPGDFFNTEHKRKIAKQYRKMFIQMDGMARPRDYKKMYGGLTAGDPKLRTLRAIYQDISCAYADYAKRFRKGGEANG